VAPTPPLEFQHLSPSTWSPLAPIDIPPLPLVKGPGYSGVHPFPESKTLRGLLRVYTHEWWLPCFILSRLISILGSFVPHFVFTPSTCCVRYAVFFSHPHTATPRSCCWTVACLYILFLFLFLAVTRDSTDDAEFTFFVGQDAVAQAGLAFLRVNDRDWFDDKEAFLFSVGIHPRHLPPGHAQLTSAVAARAAAGSSTGVSQTRVPGYVGGWAPAAGVGPAARGAFAMGVSPIKVTSVQEAAVKPSAPKTAAKRPGAEKATRRRNRPASEVVEVMSSGRGTLFDTDSDSDDLFDAVRKRAATDQRRDLPRSAQGSILDVVDSDEDDEDDAIDVVVTKRAARKRGRGPSASRGKKDTFLDLGDSDDDDDDDATDGAVPKRANRKPTTPSNGKSGKKSDNSAARKAYIQSAKEAAKGQASRGRQDGRGRKGTFPKTERLVDDPKAQEDARLRAEFMSFQASIRQQLSLQSSRLMQVLQSQATGVQGGTGEARAGGGRGDAHAEAALQVTISHHG